MLSIYIGVYKALYDYAAQAEEELNIKQNDLLYLLEKSDIDDWWKVKKRVVATGEEIVDEPSGLVPSTYIEEAPVIKTATALYDYDKQTEEELSFNENDKFNVFDLNDPDWILVGDLAKEKFGFVPSNYIQLDSTAEPAQHQQQQPQQVFQPPPQQQQAIPQQQTQIPINNFPPPPTHKDRTPDFPAPPAHRDRSQSIHLQLLKRTILVCLNKSQGLWVLDTTDNQRVEKRKKMKHLHQCHLDQLGQISWHQNQL